MNATTRRADLALCIGLGLAAASCESGADRLGGAALPQPAAATHAAADAGRGEGAAVAPIAADAADAADAANVADDVPPDVVAAAPAKPLPPVEHAAMPPIDEAGDVLAPVDIDSAGGMASAGETDGAGDGAVADGVTPGDPMVVRSGPMLEVSTRGHYRTDLWAGGKLVASHDRYDYTTNGAVPGMATGGATCPAELAVVVHGWGSSAAEAQEQFKRARAVLKLNGYGGLVVGFSWDADTAASDGRSGGDTRANAAGNGPKLAEFLDDHRYMCRTTKLHLVAHDVGALVALEAVRALRTNDDGRHGYYWNGPLAGAVIDDVHLLGAAVGDESPWLSRRFGSAIGAEVGRLVNYHSDGDDALAASGPVFPQGGEALGLDGVAWSSNPFDARSRPPANYADVDVEADLVGGASHHASYFGWPAKAGQGLESAGAMSRVRANFT